MENKTIDGPKGLPILGNVREFSGSSRMQHLQAWKKTYGDTVHLKMLGRDTYLITNPDDVYTMLVKNASKLHKSPLFKKALDPILGQGLLLSEDDFHKQQRRLAQPAFHMQRIASYADTIVDYGTQLLDSWDNKSQVDMHHDMMTVTMRIIGKVLFDADVSKDAHELGGAITIGIDATMHRISHLIKLPLWVPTPQNRQYQAIIKLLNDTINTIVNERRHTTEDRGDLLSMLLLFEDEDGNRMTDKQVKDEAMTLFLAGHETTANALTWALYLLAQHPDIRAKHLEEVDRVLGQRRATMDDLKQLTYTEMIIKETMRLYPPAWIMTRIVQAPFELSKVTPQVNNMLIISPYLVHRDPNLWDNPEVFDPERFTPEAEKERPKFAYFPFGGGPRVCIGNHFAMMEAQLLLATLSQQITADLVPNVEVTPDPSVTLRPRDGLQMILNPR